MQSGSLDREERMRDKRRGGVAAFFAVRKRGTPVPSDARRLSKKARLKPALCMCFIVQVLLLASLGVASAHGVGYRQTDNKAVALEFYYSTGETMAYQEFRVYSPDDEKNSYQSGRTDEFGRCSFIPEKPGTWRIAVRDDEGHSAEASVSITPEFFDDGGDPRSVAVNSSLPEGTELFFRAALGVSLLFNVASLVQAKRAKSAKKVKNLKEYDDLEKCI
jgi:nickel transport protein